MGLNFADVISFAYTLLVRAIDIKQDVEFYHVLMIVANCSS